MNNGVDMWMNAFTLMGFKDQLVEYEPKHPVGNWQIMTGNSLYTLKEFDEQAASLLKWGSRVTIIYYDANADKILFEADYEVFTYNLDLRKMLDSELR